MGVLRSQHRYYLHQKWYLKMVCFTLHLSNSNSFAWSAASSLCACNVLCSRLTSWTQQKYSTNGASDSALMLTLCALQMLVLLLLLLLLIELTKCVSAAVVKVIMWSRGLIWRSQVGANPIPIPQPLIWRYLGIK